MNNNKGYSLTELLLAIFVLSIVMLGIAGILRSTSQFYRNGVQEVRVQEEAQLAVNLIEELVVDATSAPVWTSSDDDESTDDSDEFVRKISFKDEEESDVEIYFAHGALDPDAPEGTVQYLPGTIFMNVTKKDGTVINDQILAEYVTSFKVAGADAPSTTGDNKISVAVGMDNNGYEYEASKEIYMRNLVENPNISIKSSLSDDDDDDDDSIAEIEINRFDPYNLTIWQKADPSKSYSGNTNFTNYFQTAVEDNCLMVKISDPYNFNSQSSGDCILTYRDYDDHEHQIKFKFVPVSLDMPTTGDNIYVHRAPEFGDVNGQGYQTYIGFKGININKAVDPVSGKCICKVKIELSDSGTSDSNEINLAHQTGISTIGQNFFYMSNGVKISMGAAPDYQANGIVISDVNGNDFPKFSYWPVIVNYNFPLYQTGGDMKVTITLDPNTGASVKTFDVDYLFRFAGNVF